MAVSTLSGQRITLHYGNPKKGSWSFDKIALTANDQQLYNLSRAFNHVQADKNEKVSVTTTRTIV